MKSPPFQAGRAQHPCLAGAALGLLLLLLGAGPICAQQAKLPAPPPTSTDNVKDSYSGVEVPDPYRWLEDQNSPETRTWINAQDQFTTSLLGKLPGRDQLQRRLTELMRVDSLGVPFARNGRYFFLKRGADQDLFVLYMREGSHGGDGILVDPHPLTPDHSTSVSLLNVSEDGSRVIYGVRAGGKDEITVHLLDTATRKDLPDRLPEGEYFPFGGRSFALKPDNSGFYYSRMTPQGPRVFSHVIGTDPARDPEIFGKGYGTDKIILAGLSENGRYLLIQVLYGSGTEQSQIYLKDLSQNGPVVPVVNDIKAFFFGEAGGDTLFVQTNWKAPNSRVLAVDLRNPGQEHWREVIPESDVPIQDMSLAGGKLIVEYTRNATSQLKIFEPSGKFLREVPLPALGTISGFRGQWGSNDAFFSFTSFAIPPTVYHYDVASGTLEVWARPAVPIESDKLEVEQFWYESKDKTRIPMFLFHRKDIRLDGSNPTLLTGYGGFDVSVTPAFSAEPELWAERGGVYAVANLRGGGEFGEAWHHAGMLGKKQNVFDDFIAAAEWLIAHHYTQPAKLAIRGQSNGGLLVGAALTQRPDLYRAVVCQYPLLDMLRYQKFLVARWWVPEYGSSDNPEQFKYLYAYSPYQNVRPGVNYPAVLLVSGDGDTRVAPLHARKMAAELQADTASGRPVLLLYDTKSGHSGGRPLGKQIEEITEVLSFLFWQLGNGPASGSR